MYVWRVLLTNELVEICSELQFGRTTKVEETTGISVQLIIIKKKKGWHLYLQI